MVLPLTPTPPLLSLAVPASRERRFWGREAMRAPAACRGQDRQLGPAVSSDPPRQALLPPPLESKQSWGQPTPLPLLSSLTLYFSTWVSPTRPQVPTGSHLLRQPGLSSQAEGNLAGAPFPALPEKLVLGEAGKLVRGICGLPIPSAPPPDPQASALGTLFGFPDTESVDN